jgi:hypothetical protein
MVNLQNLISVSGTRARKIKAAFYLETQKSRVIMTRLFCNEGAEACLTSVNGNVPL